MSNRSLPVYNYSDTKLPSRREFTLTVEPATHTHPHTHPHTHITNQMHQITINMAKSNLNKKKLLINSQVSQAISYRNFI